MKRPKEPLVHLLGFVVPEPNTGCWLWTGKIDRDGYGHAKLYGRDELAHRAFYLLSIGYIPKDKEIDHKCRMPMCVNPGHLEVVSHAVNMQRGPGRKTHCKHGHVFDARNTAIRRDRKLGKVKRACRKCNCLASKAYSDRMKANPW